MSRTRWFVIRDEATGEYLSLSRSSMSDRWATSLDSAVVYSWVRYAKNAWSRRIGQRPQLAIVQIDHLPDRPNFARKAPAADDSHGENHETLNHDDTVNLQQET